MDMSAQLSIKKLSMACLLIAFAMVSPALAAVMDANRIKLSDSGRHPNILC
jgi:hypothetical protein